MNSLWQTEEFRNCILEKKETATATGSPLNIYPVEDGSVEPVIFGVTMQASSPTPDIPVALNCVTGNVTAIGGVVSNSITLPTGLHGIGTSKDSLDLATGECERKVGVVAFDGSETWTEYAPASTLTNLVSNGDFSNGTTGWTALYSSLSVADNTATLTGDGSTTSIRLRRDGLNPINNHVYAVTVKMRTSKTATSLAVNFAQSTPYQFNPTINTWYPKTFLMSGTFASAFMPLVIFASTAAQSGAVVDIQYVSCVDLTAAFGAGNEPTQTEYETWISKFNDSWFDSTTPKSWTGYPYAFSTEIADATSDGESMCSHFALGAAAYGTYSVSGTDFIFCSDMELIAFKAWLAAQLAESTPVTVAYELSASTTESFATNSLDIYANHTKIYSEAFPDDCEIVLTNVWERYEPEFDIILSGTVGEQTVYLDGSVIKECTFDDTCTSGNNLSIGDFVGKQLDVSFFDFDGVYTDTIWNGLELSFSYIVKRPNDEWYSVKKGTFIVEESRRSDGVVFLSMTDYRRLFDKSVIYPTAAKTVYQMMQDVCTTCGVALGTSSGDVLNSAVNIIVPYTPEMAGNKPVKINCLEIVSLLAACSGSIARINSDDKLVFEWFADVSPEFSYSSDVILKGQTVSDGSVYISGVKWIEPDGTEHLSGTEDYCIVIEGNPAFVADWNSFMSNLAGRLIGFEYTPCNSRVSRFNPAIESLDVISVYDKNNNEISMPIMRHTVSGSRAQKIASIGEGTFKKGASPVSVTAAIKRSEDFAVHRANVAQSTADGKTRVFLESAEPSEDLKIGDVWYDSSAGNKMHHWDGAAWNADLFDTDAFAAKSITSEKIATGAVTAASGIIADLDASKIVVGPLASYSAGYDPTLIAVGGRNLALGTEIDAWSAYSADTSLYRSNVNVTNLVTNGNFVNATGWSAADGSLSVANNTATHTSNGAQTYARLIRTDSASTVGHTYALTLRVRVTNSSCTMLSASIYNSTGVTIQATPVANQWYQLTVLQTITNAQAYIWIVHNYATTAIASGKKMEVQYVSCVDLSAGRASLPTQSDYARWIATQPNAWIDGTANTKGLYRTNSITAVSTVTGSGRSLGMQQSSAYRTMKLTEGATYTISVLARGSANAIINTINIGNTGTTSQYLSPSWQMTSAWQKFSYTFTADANTGASTGSHLLFRHIGDVVSGSTWFEIQEVKIEAGNKATDWCPDTLDMAFPDTTTIDGGNIKTGKIESHDGKTYFNLDNDEIVMDGGANGKVKINPTVGFQLLDESDVFVGGIANVGGVLGLIAQKIAGTADPTVWGQIGDNITGGGMGLELVRKTGGVFFIAARLANGGFALLDHSEVSRFSADDTSTRLYDAAGVVRFTGDTTTRLYDAAGVGRFYADGTSTQLYDADGYERLILNGTANYSILRAKNGASHNEIGVDATGAYKITAGTKTYL